MSVKHTFQTGDGTVTKVITKARAIRAHCLNCSGFQPGEVAKCTCHDCALYPFRFGNEKGLDRMYVDKAVGAEPDEEIDDEDEEWESIVDEDEELE